MQPKSRAPFLAMKRGRPKTKKKSDWLKPYTLRLSKKTIEALEREAKDFNRDADEKTSAREIAREALEHYTGTDA